MLSPRDYRPAPPDTKPYGIGIVGCGNIVRHAHLPAYRDFGYRVVACMDVDPEAVRATQAAFGIPFGTTDLRALLDREDVEILDVAVPASARREVMEVVSQAGKPILSQKPLAMRWEDAVAIVAMCEARGALLMVNQQARWAPAHRAIRCVIESGALGHVYSIVHFHRSFQDIPGSWYVALPDFNFVDHGIHYFDLIRYFAGRNPVRVKATATRVPGQNAVSPMFHTALVEFEPEAQLSAVSHFNNIVAAPALHDYRWFVDGTEGSLQATHTELVFSSRSAPEQKVVLEIAGRWFPDAFGGSMGELMRALAEGREPATSGRDHLESLRLACAALRSAATGEAVALSEIR